MLTLKEIIDRLQDRKLYVLEKEIGISYNTLYTISRGKANPTHETMKKISDYLEKK